MKNIIILFAVMSLTLGCRKESITTPADTIYTDECPEYTILDGYIGIWGGSTIMSASGNVITVGRANKLQNSHMLLYKTTTDGDVLFSSTFHEVKSRAQSVYEDAQQHLYVVGTTYGESASAQWALAVAKLNRDGEVIWEKTYHPEVNIIGYRVEGANENEIIISGESGTETVLLKIDSLGEELQFQITGGTSQNTSPPSMLVLQNGHILITRTIVNSAIQLDCYDTAFNLVWEEEYGLDQIGRNTIQLDNGELITVGKSIHRTAGSSSVDSFKVMILKTTPNGDLIWEKEVGNIAFENDGLAIAENEDGSFVISGTASSGSFFEKDHMLIHVDTAGNEIHNKYYTDETGSVGRNILKTSGGRNIITGGREGGIFFLNVNNEGL